MPCRRASASRDFGRTSARSACGRIVIRREFASGRNASRGPRRSAFTTEQAHRAWEEDRAISESNAEPGQVRPPASRDGNHGGRRSARTESLNVSASGVFRIDRFHPC
jgi:hypothetical protein